MNSSPLLLGVIYDENYSPNLYHLEASQLPVYSHPLGPHSYPLFYSHCLLIKASPPAWRNINKARVVKPIPKVTKPVSDPQGADTQSGHAV